MSDQGTAVATLQPSRMPLPPAVARDYNITAGKWRVLIDSVFPAARSIDAVLMAVAYCNERKLDILKKPVHIVPMWSSALGRMVETVWPSIAEIRTTAARTGEYGGIDEVVLGPMLEGEFEGVVEQWVNRAKTQANVTKKVRYPEWASVVVYRWVKGEKAAFHTKIFWTETYASLGKTRIPNDMWEKRPIGQFDKCLEAAALRKAFPEEVGNMYAAEEMEGRTIEHDAAEVVATPKPPRPDSAPPKPNGVRGQQTTEQTAEKQHPKPANDQSELAGKQVEDAQVDEPSFTRDEGFDPETGEVAEETQTQVVERDPSDTLTLLEGRLEGAVGALDVEEIWNEMDLSSVFTHLPDAESWIGMAKKIRDRFLNKIKNPKAGK